MLRDNSTQEVRKLDLCGLFFAIGHAPATKFLKKQLQLDEYGYIVTKPDSTATSVPGEQQPAHSAARVCACCASSALLQCASLFAMLRVEHTMTRL
jgi:alkyl hydroperoxide reductase subunit AhpF